MFRRASTYMAKRAKTFKILLMSALVVLTPSAFARPAKPAAHAAVAKKLTAHATATRKTGGKKQAAEKTPSHQPARAHTEATAKGKHSRDVKVERAHTVPREQPASRKHGSMRVREEAGSRAAVRAHGVARTQGHPPAPVVRVEARPARIDASPVVIAAKPAAAAMPATPAMPAAQAEETAVKHDRKHHLPAEVLPAPVPASAPNGLPAPDNSGKVTPPDSASGSAEASAALFTKAGRLIMPPAMKGSHEILVHQNVMADQDGLERVQDDDDLDRMRGSKTLLPLPQSAGLQTDDRLPENRRFARPWTVKFLEVVARAHYERFHTALQINSAVRTVEFQQKLVRVNGNAAPAEGETASPHLTGQAVDLAKKGLSMTEIAWLRGYLLPLVQQGKIDVEEEFQQSCFHISVYRKYVPDAAPRREIVNRPVSGSAIASAMR